MHASGLAPMEVVGALSTSRTDFSSIDKTLVRHGRARVQHPLQIPFVASRMRCCARRSFSLSARAPGDPPVDAAAPVRVVLPAEVVGDAGAGEPARTPLAVPRGGAAGLPLCVPAGLLDGVAAGLPDCAPAGLAAGGDADGLPVWAPGDAPPPTAEPLTPPDEDAPPAPPPVDDCPKLAAGIAAKVRTRIGITIGRMAPLQT